MLVFYTSRTHMVLEGRAYIRATSIVTSRSFLNNSCRFKMHLVTRRRDRNQLPEFTNISVFKWGKNNSTRITLVYHEFANFFESYTPGFNIDVISNLTEMAPVIVKACMVPSARHLHSRWCITPGIGRLIKSDVMKNWCHFPTKSTQSC